jgi:hypothetical protein
VLDNSDELVKSHQMCVSNIAGKYKQSHFCNHFVFANTAIRRVIDFGCDLSYIPF